MVTPAFGFSVGDFIAGTKLLVNVYNSFKETGGASSRFASQSAFLMSLTSTVDRLNEYIQNTPQNEISEDISKLVNVIKDPLNDFKKLLDKHEAVLGKQSTKSGVEKIGPTLKFVLKELSGKTEDLRRQVEQPLQAINSLLVLQIIKSLKETHLKELFQPEQLAQLVEAIRVADIPSELGKQIHVLQRSADSHRLQQDVQLQNMKDLHDNLVDGLTKLQSTNEEIKRLSTSAASRAQPTVKLDQDSMDTIISSLTTAPSAGGDQLHKDMEEQTRLIMALMSFLEDQAIAQQSNQEKKKQTRNDETTWPSEILATVQLATAVISVFVSGTVTAYLNKYDWIWHSGRTVPSTSVAPEIYNQMQPEQTSSLSVRDDLTFSESTANTSSPIKPPPKTSDVSSQSTSHSKEKDSSSRFESIWSKILSDKSSTREEDDESYSRRIKEPGPRSKLSKPAPSPSPSFYGAICAGCYNNIRQPESPFCSSCMSKLPGSSLKRTAPSQSSFSWYSGGGSSNREGSNQTGHEMSGTRLEMQAYQAVPDGWDGY